MPGIREPIEKFYMNVLTKQDNKDLVYEFNIANQSVVSVMWGSLCYRIIREQLCGNFNIPCNHKGKCKLKNYKISGVTQTFKDEVEFRAYLIAKKFKVVLARLLLIATDEFEFEFEVVNNKEKYGSLPNEYDTDAGQDWIKPRCVKLFYPKTPSGFQPEDVFNECRLRGELANKHISNHVKKHDGNIAGVFFCIGQFDCINYVLFPFYKNRPDSSDIKDIVTQAKIGKKCNFKGPVGRMNVKKITDFWDYEYEEFGQKRSASYLLKSGKCPIGSGSFLAFSG